MKAHIKNLILGMGIASLVACSSHSGSINNRDYDNYRAATSSEVITAGLGKDAAFPGAGAGELNEASGRKNNTLYFGFDSNRVRPQYQPTLEANAKYLRTHPRAKLRLEGHTDPRGSREYNVGLGQRRANQVAEQLLLLGAEEDQLVRVSYGKEKLAALGDDEEAYQLDRRVEMIYEAS